MKIALRETGVAFEAMLADDFGRGEKGTAFTAANPRSEIPAEV